MKILLKAIALLSVFAILIASKLYFNDDYTIYLSKTGELSKAASTALNDKVEAQITTSPVLIATSLETTQSTRATVVEGLMPTNREMELEMALADLDD